MRVIDEGAIVDDETGSKMPGPGSGTPAEVDAPVPATPTFLSEARSVIRVLAYLALMLVLAVVVSRAMQFVMGLLGFTGG